MAPQFVRLLHGGSLGMVRHQLHGHSLEEARREFHPSRLAEFRGDLHHAGHARLARFRLEGLPRRPLDSLRGVRLLHNQQGVQPGHGFRAQPPENPYTKRRFVFLNR